MQSGVPQHGTGALNGTRRRAWSGRQPLHAPYSPFNHPTHPHRACSHDRQRQTRTSAQGTVDGPAAVVTKDLRVMFTTKDSAKEVLKGVDLQIKRGSLHMLLGPNGCGKSTLLKVLGGLVPAASGHVGTDEPTGFVFQNPDHQVVMPTVGADVAFGLGRYDLKEEQVRHAVQCALELVNMGDAIQRPTHTLSGGQRQRVAIAGALAENPRILLLDELTTFLDVEDQFGVLTAVKEITRRGTGFSAGGKPSDSGVGGSGASSSDDSSKTGARSHPGLNVSQPVTAIWVTHRFEELQYADSASYMQDGRVVFTGSADEMVGYLKRLGAAGV